MTTVKLSEFATLRMSNDGFVAIVCQDRSRVQLTCDETTALFRALKLSELVDSTYWEISHPGTGEKLRCKTFNEAMERWFEGHNVPVRVVMGVREDFKRALARVKAFYKNTIARLNDVIEDFTV